MKNNYERWGKDRDGANGALFLKVYFSGFIKKGLIKSFLGLCLMTVSLFGYGQGKTNVSGVVAEQETGDPLPGVSVQVKGTNTGTITDVEGKYRVSAGSEDILVFSFIGFEAQEVSVNGQSEISISLTADIQQLEDVVVTAFGLEREKKAVTYSVQKISTDEFSEARSLNVVNSLSGKVAGLNFSTTGSGVGSSSRITLRGNRSLTGNNQPLFVIDGVPMDNNMSSKSSTPSTDIGGLTSFDGISNINPEDIESISVLKGPSAAALYGTRASNGVIIINTKKGASGQAKISVSSNLMFSKAYDLLNQQNEYGQGTGGVYDPASRSSWGPEMTGQSVAAWQLSHNPDYAGPATYSLTPQSDNSSSFFETGYNWAKTISASMGNESMQGYFSYTNTESEGIVKGNRLDRHNVNLRLTSDLTSKLKLDVKTNFISQKVENAIKAGEESIGEAVYTMIRSMPFDQYKEFEYIDAAGDLQYNYPSPNSIGEVGGNPYWFALRNPRTDERNRIISFASLKYNFTDELSVQVRTGIDHTSNTSEESRYAALAVINSDLGSYSERFEKTREINSDFLVAYDKSLGDLAVNVSFGGNAMAQERSSLNTGGVLSRRNFFSISNVSNQTPSPDFYEKQIHSLYGFAQFGFREYLFLDITARNDWSSALPSDSRSYFYPSVGLSGVISDMFSIDSDVLTFLKTRASYAQVGNDTDPYRVIQELEYYGVSGGFVQASTTINNANLKPEISTSTELGLDARFLDNRIGLDFTWFKTNTVDQIFTSDVAESSGASKKIVNGGEIENKGIELVVNASIVKSNDFSWDVTANYSNYDTKVLSLNEGRDELIISTGSERLARTIIKTGGEYGDLYIKGFNRTDDGQVIVDASGMPEFTPGFDVLAGNFNPDWTGGLQNSFNYKDFSMSFLVDFRIGGEVISYTQSRMAGAGVSDITLAGRTEGFVVDGVVVTRDEDGNIVSTTPNTTSILAEDYWSVVAQRGPASAEDFVFDATNIRLRELVLGYSVPGKLLTNGPFSGVSISLVGRNLFFFTNKAKYFDPEQSVSVGNLQGIESYNIPSTRDYGFNVKLNF